MAYVFLSTSAIDRLFEERSKAFRSASSQASAEDNTGAPIRRPYRGIQIKKDTYATMSIVNGAGTPLPVVSSSDTNPERDSKGKGQVTVYADFIIESISEQRVEKNQIIETFGNSFVFFFGERPRIVTISGVLVNTEDFDWRSQFFYNYENHLRGTKLVEQNARLFLSYDTRVMEGYPLQVSAEEVANDPYLVRWSMQILLTNFRDFGRIGIVDFPPAPMPRDFDALNRDLELRALDFNTGLTRSEGSAAVDTVAAVRIANLESRFTQSVSLGGLLRDGIRAVNNFTTSANSAIQSGYEFLSGRISRKPLGVAGFYAQLQGATLGVGVTEGILDSFELLGITDTNLRVRRSSGFAAVPESILRTRISQNFDEYPLVSDKLSRPLDNATATALKKKRAREQLVLEGRELESAVLADLARFEGAVLDNIEDVVELTRTGFAVYNTVNSAIGDLDGVLLDALGLSGVVDLVT